MTAPEFGNHIALSSYTGPAPRGPAGSWRGNTGQPCAYVQIKGRLVIVLGGAQRMLREFVFPRLGGSANDGMRMMRRPTVQGGLPACAAPVLAQGDACWALLKRTLPRSYGRKSTKRGDADPLCDTNVSGVYGGKMG